MTTAPLALTDEPATPLRTPSLLAGSLVGQPCQGPTPQSVAAPVTRRLSAVVAGGRGRGRRRRVVRRLGGRRCRVIRGHRRRRLGGGGLLVGRPAGAVAAGGLSAAWVSAVAAVVKMVGERLPVVRQPVCPPCGARRPSAVESCRTDAAGAAPALREPGRVHAADPLGAVASARGTSRSRAPRGRPPRVPSSALLAALPAVAAAAERDRRRASRAAEGKALERQPALRAGEAGAPGARRRHRLARPRRIMPHARLHRTPAT